MGRLVPFPETVASLPDADLLDLSLTVATDETLPPGSSAVVRVSARYATSARRSQIDTFYTEALDAAGATSVHRSESCSGHRLVLEAVLPWTPPGQISPSTLTTYRVTVDEDRGYRSVKIAVRYDNFDHHQIFDRFATWHNGDAPVSTVSQPTGLEISTFATGRLPSTVVLYTTHYHCPQTPRQVRRAIVDDRIRQLGWDYREPREGIMFMRDAAFDAETHVSGDDRSSVVTFVGEFQLR